MKKSYLYIIIAVLLIAAIVLYIHPRASSVAEPVDSVPVATTTNPVTTTPTQAIAVAGMKEYTDPSFGFSFWYPSNWQVSSGIPSFDDGNNVADATVVKKLTVGVPNQTENFITIKEAHSTTRTFTDTGGAGPIGPITYFFDTNSHLWMTRSDITGANVTTAADISNNSMGGLHLFGGTSRFDTTIIPLSADNFLMISDNGGEASATALAKTVLATDPSVATPVSAADQIKAIQTEKNTI
jgi:hypothetical protein